LLYRFSLNLHDLWWDTLKMMPYLFIIFTVGNTFDVWASSTNLTICARALSAPTCLASIINVPCWLMEPPITSEPGFLLTGIDSPVIRDSSHIDCPSSTLPSTGTFSPGTTCQLMRRLPTYNNLTIKISIIIHLCKVANRWISDVNLLSSPVINIIKLWTCWLVNSFV